MAAWPAIRKNSTNRHVHLTLLLKKVIHSIRLKNFDIPHQFRLSGKHDVDGS